MIRWRLMALPHTLKFSYLIANFSVCNKVRRNIISVKLHPFRNIQVIVRTVSFLPPHFTHGISYHISYFIVVSHTESSKIARSLFSTSKTYPWKMCHPRFSESCKVTSGLKRHIGVVFHWSFGKSEKRSMQTKAIINRPKNVIIHLFRHQLKISRALVVFSMPLVIRIGFAAAATTCMIQNQISYLNTTLKIDAGRTVNINHSYSYIKYKF